MTPLVMKPLRLLPDVPEWVSLLLIVLGLALLAHAAFRRWRR